MMRKAFLPLVFAIGFAGACGGQSIDDDGSGGSSGSSGKGGTTSTGGTSRGGTTSAGGTTSTGGTSAGGTTSTGGTSRGGTTSTGGTGATGGTGRGGSGGSVGGSGAFGGSGGSLGGSGGTVAGTGGTGCCLAFPTCADGEVPLANSSECGSYASCREVAVCCSVIWCGSGALCDAVPTCDEGDTQLMGECPPDVSCYTRSLCGTTITCRDDRCDPATEPHRQYVSTNPGECVLLDFTCTGNTTYFMNDCGCGCEQSAQCPAHLGCVAPAIDNRRSAGGTGGVPASGNEDIGAAPEPPGSGGARPVPALCSEEDLLRCPFSETY